MEAYYCFGSSLIREWRGVVCMSLVYHSNGIDTGNSPLKDDVWNINISDQVRSSSLYSSYWSETGTNSFCSDLRNRSCSTYCSFPVFKFALLSSGRPVVVWVLMPDIFFYYMKIPGVPMRRTLDVSASSLLGHKYWMCFVSKWVHLLQATRTLLYTPNLMLIGTHTAVSLFESICQFCYHGCWQASLYCRPRLHWLEHN